MGMGEMKEMFSLLFFLFESSCLLIKRFVLIIAF